MYAIASRGLILSSYSGRLAVNILKLFDSPYCVAGDQLAGMEKDNIKEWTGQSMSSLLCIANYRDRWAVMVAVGSVGVPK